MRFRKFLKPYKTRGSSFREHTIESQEESNFLRFLLCIGAVFLQLLLDLTVNTQ